MKNKNSAAIALRSIDGEDVTTWVLPEDAIARLGRGRSNDVAFSPDGQYFRRWNINWTSGYMNFRR